MTTPHRDIVMGCLDMLQQQPDVLAVVGVNAEGPLLFPYRLFQIMEGTQSIAAVISTEGGWAGPNVHNTLRFPRLTLEIYADPQRDAGNNATHPAQSRADHAYRVIDRHLHRPEGGTEMWGATRTIACARTTEPIVYPVPDGDGLIRLFVAYGVTEG